MSPSPIMIKEQREWEAGEIEKLEKGLHDSRRKKKERKLVHKLHYVTGY